MSEHPSHDLAWLALQYICDELAADEHEAFERRLAEDQTAREAVAEAVEQCAAIRVVCRSLAGDPYAADPARSAETAPAQVVMASGKIAAADATAADVTAAPVATRSRRKFWRRAAVAAAWMTAGAAASLAALLWLPGGGDKPDAVPVAAAPDADAAALARAYFASESIEAYLAPWSSLAAGSRDGELTSLEPGLITAGADGDEAYSDSADEAVAGGSASPASWESLPVDPLVPQADDWMLALVALDSAAAAGDSNETEH